MKPRDLIKVIFYTQKLVAGIFLTRVSSTMQLHVGLIQCNFSSDVTTL